MSPGVFLDEEAHLYLEEETVTLKFREVKYFTG